MKLIFISGVSGVGKSETCNYIKDNNILEDYKIFDIDELENINEYNSDSYNLFYENAIKKAIIESNNKNIIIGSCINPTDIEKINIPNEIDNVEMILITCSEEQLMSRLKSRDKNRNCSADEFIQGQIEYQNYILNHLNMYNLHIDNSNSSIEDIANQIINYIKKN